MNKLQHIKIFIADDHPVISQGIICMLSNEANMTVVGSALSGEEMTHSLPQARPTVLLLDLNMPGSDFYENIAWVKKHAPWVKIIVYSGYYSPELVKSLFQKGVVGYVSKTSNSDQLIEAIQAVEAETFAGIPAQFANPETASTCGSTDWCKVKIHFKNPQFQVIVIF